MSEEVVRSPGVDSVLASQWAQVRGRLRSEFGEATFRSWLKPLTLLGQCDAQVSIAVKTRFMRDWISQHYAERIRAFWHAANPDIRSIEFVVDGSRPQAMTAAGYRRCYNVAEGFEGNPDTERHRGKTGGWKAAGLPWVQD